MKLKTFASALLIGLSAAVAQAHSFKLGELDIAHPYARATVAGQPGGTFLSIENHGADDRLIGASAEVSQKVELHTMSIDDNNVMRMRQVEAIDLPKGGVTQLKPGGLHIMLIGLKSPLKAGDSFPLKLRFEKAGELEVKVTVEGPGASH